MKITYDLNGIKNMLEDFYILTGSRIAVFDENFREIYAYPSRLSDYCRTIRRDKKLDSRCVIDDYTNFKRCEHTLSAIIYTCHAGLFEIIVPIVVDELLKGYLMSGQIYSQDSTINNPEAVYSRFNNFTFNINKLMTEFEKANKTTTKKINSAKNLMEIYSRHISQTLKNSTNSDPLALKIDSYILQNITNDICVDDMCNHFGLKKTNFHKITKSLFGVSIMQYVRQLRIEKAKRLLIDTENKIGEIAESVGMDDYNYFTKFFKAQVNCTPREYRKNNKAFAKNNIRAL